MPEEDLSPISKLLRMKRHEQPPPEYFDNFLREFQERQRAELLRRPAWRIAMERLQARFTDLSREITSRLVPAQLAYAGASSAVLVIAAVFTANMLQHPGGMPSGSIAMVPQGQELQTIHQVQQVQPQPAVVAELPVRLASGPVPTHPARFTLNDPEILFPDFIPSDASRITRPAQQGQVRQHPRYILDTRPASYEPPFSF